MQRELYSRILMAGADPLVAAYRAHGLFERWRIEHVTRPLDFAAALAQHGRVVVHVHARAGRFWLPGAFMAAALAARCPLIVQLHGTGFRAEAGWLLKHAAAVCVPCEAMRAWLRSVARDVQALLLPPLANSSIEPMAVSSQGSKPNLVLFLGALEARTGVFDLLEAIAAVRAGVPDVQLACAGEGERAAVLRFAQRLGIADAVKFVGSVGPSGKRALLEHAAVFVLPGYEESLPLGLAEAMSAGLPVVASRVGGIPEVVADGGSGLLFAPGDKASLQRALRRLLVDRTLATRLGAAARDSARHRFGPERALAPLEELYASLGACSPQARPGIVQVGKAA